MARGRSSHSTTTTTCLRLAGGADVTDAAAWTSLTTTQRISMLEVLLAAQAAKKADDKLTSDHTALARMDELYGLTASGNAEVLVSPPKPVVSIPPTSLSLSRSDTHTPLLSLPPSDPV